MGIGVSSHDQVRRARGVAGGCGRLGYICGDGITCLSRRLDDFARGLFSVRGAALDGADGLHWSAPRA
jgi:hypothetical protein